MPIDYATAKKAGMIRKPSSFISTICDDRGDELRYAGIPVSQVFKEVGPSHDRHMMPDTTPPAPCIYRTRRHASACAPACLLVRTWLARRRFSKTALVPPPLAHGAQQDLGVGGVVSLLWFRRRLPIYATKFIEMIMMVTADHGE
jgi:hypothetical protein